MMRRGATVAALALILATGAAPLAARADPPAEAPAADAAVPDALLTALGEHATRFEEMKRRGAFTMNGKIEEVDGDGAASDTKEILLRSTPTPTPMDRITKVFHYTENGEDKTEDAQKRATERRAKRLKDPDAAKDAKKADMHLPFLPSERARYVFSIAERDANNPHRVRIAFAPKVPAEDAFKGSAWADDATGDILSVGFSLSKNPTFVDHVEVTITFGLPTPLGNAPSRISFDGRGGFLFIHKHFRGVATLSEPIVAF